MIDLYIRPDEDNKEILEIYDPISEFIQQIEVLFFTSPGEVLGEPEMGIDLERYVHELSLNEYDIKQKINAQIKKYSPLALNYNYNVDIFFARSETGIDSALINVSIENNTILGVVI